MFVLPVCTHQHYIPRVVFTPLEILKCKKHNSSAKLILKGGRHLLQSSSDGGLLHKGVHSLATQSISAKIQLVVA